jgi:hypothetical protein
MAQEIPIVRLRLIESAILLEKARAGGVGRARDCFAASSEERSFWWFGVPLLVSDNGALRDAAAEEKQESEDQPERRSLVSLFTKSRLSSES